MVKVTNRIAVRVRMEQLTSPEAVEQIGKALFVGGNIIQTDAQRSITDGSVSGKFHVPSSPGEPPNADTHTLDRQIETARVGPLHVQVTSNARYSAFLEFGTSRMEARPFMLPASAQNRDKVVELVRDAVARIMQRTGTIGGSNASS